MCVDSGLGQKMMTLHFFVAAMQVGGTEAALFDYARGGPQWGADALVIGPPQVSHDCSSCIGPACTEACLLVY